MFFLRISDERYGSDTEHHARIGRYHIDLETSGYDVIEREKGGFLISLPGAGIENSIMEVGIPGGGRTVNVHNPTRSGRPIYYHNTGSTLLLSTSVRKLRDNGIKIRENTPLLPEFFVYRYVIPPNSLYKNIKRLESGSTLKIRVGDRIKIGVGDYYPPKDILDKDPREYIGDLKGVFDRILESYSGFDDSISLVLSGGMDSTILSKLFIDRFGIRDTYSTGYPFIVDGDNVEREYAETAAEALNTRHHYYQADPDDYYRAFMDSVYEVEEPLHHIQTVMMYLMMKNGIPDKRKFVVSGLGADGLFGNKTHFLTHRNHRLFYRILSTRIVKGFLGGVSRLTGIGSGFVSGLFDVNSDDLLRSGDHPIWSLGRYGDVSWVEKNYDTDSEEIVKHRYQKLEMYRDRSIYDKISLLAFHGGGSTGRALWSKMGDGFGKYILYPFTEKELVDYSFRIPWDVKLSENKYMLKKLAYSIDIPKFIIERPKSGFALDPGYWGKKGGVLEPLLKISLKTYKGIDIQSLRSDNTAKAMIVWNIINYSIWKRLMIDNEPLRNLKGKLEDAGH